jgi:hypothetical protein
MTAPHDEAAEKLLIAANHIATCGIYADVIRASGTHNCSGCFRLERLPGVTYTH